MAKHHHPSSWTVLLAGPDQVLLPRPDERGCSSVSMNDHAERESNQTYAQLNLQKKIYVYMGLLKIFISENKIFLIFF